MIFDRPVNMGNEGKKIMDMKSSPKMNELNTFLVEKKTMKWHNSYKSAILAINPRNKP